METLSGAMPRRSFPVILLSLVGVATLSCVIAGCGGGGASKPVASPKPTASTTIKRSPQSVSLPTSTLSPKVSALDRRVCEDIEESIAVGKTVDDDSLSSLQKTAAEELKAFRSLAADAPASISTQAAAVARDWAFLSGQIQKSKTLAQVQNLKSGQVTKTYEDFNKNYAAMDNFVAKSCLLG